MSKQTTDKNGKTVQCDGVINGRKRKGFSCPKHKRGYPSPGKIKCKDCFFATWKSKKSLK